jgi:hypothetical protein
LGTRFVTSERSAKNVHESDCSSSRPTGDLEFAELELQRGADGDAEVGVEDARALAAVALPPPNSGTSWNEKFLANVPSVMRRARRSTKELFTTPPPSPKKRRESSCTRPRRRMELAASAEASVKPLSPIVIFGAVLAAAAASSSLSSCLRSSTRSFCSSCWICSRNAWSSSLEAAARRPGETTARLARARRTEAYFLVSMGWFLSNASRSLVGDFGSYVMVALGSCRWAEN